MKRLVTLTLVTVVAIVSLGTRFDHDARCDAIALEIVKTWFENGPILPIDIERIEKFEQMRCPEGDLEDARQKILRGEVEPWVNVNA